MSIYCSGRPGRAGRRLKDGTFQPHLAAVWGDAIFWARVEKYIERWCRRTFDDDSQG